MDQMQQNYVYDVASKRHGVLRNTYWLLALSMIPTILGAWLGVQMDFSFFNGSPLLGWGVLMLICYGCFFAIEKTKDSALGVFILLGFTFFMGLILSRMIGMVLHKFTNGSDLIILAFGATATVFGVMATIATTTKRDFSGWGTWLFAAMIAVFVCGAISIFFNLGVFSIVVSTAISVLFSIYIMYDVQQVINGGETNYVRATLKIYIDLWNVFTSLLRLLSIFAGDRR